MSISSLDITTWAEIRHLIRQATAATAADSCDGAVAVALVLWLWGHSRGAVKAVVPVWSWILNNSPYRVSINSFKNYLHVCTLILHIPCPPPPIGLENLVCFEHVEP